MNINSRRELPRKTLPVIFVFDTSGSMRDEKIEQVNSFIEELPQVLGSIAQKETNANIKVGILEFSTGARWITHSLEDLMEEFVPIQFTARGLTDVRDMLFSLDQALSSHALLNDVVGNYMPVIIFVTDGYSTQDYQEALEKIRQNKWYRNGTKIGIGIGDDADCTMIANVVGTPNNVITLRDFSKVGRLLQLVTVTSSIATSGTRPLETNDTSSDFIMDEIKNNLESDGDFHVGATLINEEAFIPEQEPQFEGWAEDTWNLESWS